jgi:hypothetical protein
VRSPIDTSLRTVNRHANHRYARCSSNQLSRLRLPFSSSGGAGDRVGLAATFSARNTAEPGDLPLFSSGLMSFSAVAVGSSCCGEGRADSSSGDRRGGGSSGSRISATSSGSNSCSSSDSEAGSSSVACGGGVGTGNTGRGTGAQPECGEATAPITVGAALALPDLPSASGASFPHLKCPQQLRKPSQPAIASAQRGACKLAVLHCDRNRLEEIDFSASHAPTSLRVLHCYGNLMPRMGGRRMQMLPRLYEFYP